jgi:tetratricopeptide (TPR) repeat protein
LYYNYAGLLRKCPPSDLSGVQLQNTIVEYYKKAYAIQPEKHILRRLADYYTKDLNQIDAARATWHWCLQEHPDYGAAWIALAQLEIQEKQWLHAQQALKQALALRDKGIWVEADQIYYLLGMINWKGWGNFDAAQQHFEQALDENKYFAAPLEALLKLSTSIENHQQAIHYYKLALEMQPMNIFLLIKLAKLYAQTENYNKAIETYQEILEISPNYTPALEGLEQLQRF